MNGPFASVLAWLVDFLCLATVLLAMALAARVAVRQPVSRVTLSWATCCAILVGGSLLALPAWPRIEVARLLARPVDLPPPVIRHESATAQAVYPIAEPLARTGLANVVVPTAVSRAAFSPAAIGVRAWALIALLACAWLAVGWARAWRLIARSRPAPDWIERELRQVIGPRSRWPAVLANQQIATPLALGTLRPRIVLPLASITHSNTAALRAALAHEWAHIVGGDLWLLALERSLVPLLALHPLFWWLRRLTRLDQELAADAAAAGDHPAEYAAALLAWARQEPHPRAGFAALAMWERPSNLSRRIRMLLDPSPRTDARRGRLAAYALVLAFFALSLVLSIFSWAPMAAQEPDRPMDVDVVLPAPLPAEPPIMVEMQLLSLDPQALAVADVDLLGALRRSRGRKGPQKPGLIWAELADQDARELLAAVQNSKAAQILSRPKLITLNGREANLVVGGQVPIAEVDEIVNGERRERRIESKDIGTTFRIKPQILAENPRHLVLEVSGETTALNPRRAAGQDADAVPLLRSQKVELRATIELGKTLVLLAAAPETRSVEVGLARRDAEQSLLVVLRPSLVEHKYVEVDPTPTVPTQSTAAAAATTVVDSVDEARLAEQLRSIRVALEQLAREREATRRENAALKQELERLKRLAEERSSAASPSTAPAAANAREPLPPTPQATHVYEFPSSELAKSAAERLSAEGRAAKLRIAVMVQSQHVTVLGPPTVLQELQAELSKHGNLVTESLSGPPTAQVVVPAPQNAADRGMAWLIAQQARGQWNTGSGREQPSAEDRRTHRRLLALDLEGAELELQAAQEDLEYAQNLYEQKTISQEEVRKYRRAVDKAKIQVARLKVMLEDEQDQPAAGPAPTSQRQLK